MLVCYDHDGKCHSVSVPKKNVIIATCGLESSKLIKPYYLRSEVLSGIDCQNCLATKKVDRGRCKCLPNNQCKPCYDKARHRKIKNGDWEYNAECPATLTSEQEQVLIGGLLGDFYLYQNKNHINAGISSRRAEKDIEYMKYEYNLYKDFCSNVGISEETNVMNFKQVKLLGLDEKFIGAIHKGISFRTRVQPVFTPFKEKWYPEGKKIVPKDLKLTPLICAIWFCDDGCIVRMLRKTMQDKLRLQLSTDGFTKKEVLFLISLLEKEIGGEYHCSHKRKEHYYIRAEHDTAVKFIKYIEPVFPQSMKRKSDKWKGI